MHVVIAASGPSCATSRSGAPPNRETFKSCRWPMHGYTDSRATSIDRDASSSRLPVSSGTTPRINTSLSETFGDLRGSNITTEPTFHAPCRLLLIEPRTFGALAQRIGSLARDWSEAMRSSTAPSLTLSQRNETRIAASIITTHRCRNSLSLYSTTARRTMSRISSGRCFRCPTTTSLASV